MSLVAFVPSASAVDTGHAFSFSFSGSGTNALTTQVQDIAIRQSNGDVYALDQGARRVDVFDASGNFKFMFGKEVNATTHGNLCTAVETCQTGSFGTLPEALSSAYLIAIDQVTGSVYVVGQVCCSTYTIAKYDSEGHVETSWQTNGITTGTTSPSGKFKSVSGIDTDAAGDLLISADFSPARVVKYNPAGTTITEFTLGFPVMGAGQGDAFAWSPQGFEYFNNSQEAVWTLLRASASDGTGKVNFSPFWSVSHRYPEAIAVDGSNGDVYQIADISGERAVLEWQVEPGGQPKQANGSACSTTLTSNEGGCAATHEFGFSKYEGGIGTPGYQSTLDVNSTTHAVYTAGYAPTASGSPKGRINVYVKSPAPLALTGEPTANKTVSGTAKPDGAGEIVECEFEYGTTRDYGLTAPCSPAPNYASEQAVSAELTAANETTYHYRLVVKNAGEATALGQDKTITPHNVLGVETLSAEEVERSSAKLRGTYLGNGEPTEFHFRWGTTSFNHESAPASTGSPAPSGATEVSFTATNLEPQKTYKYEVVFTNAEGTTIGNEKTFETKRAVQGLTTAPATAVERQSAVLHGSFEAPGTEGEGENEYWFEYGLFPGVYTKSTPVQTTGATGTITAEAPVSGLNYQASYHYRLVAKNDLGETLGNDQIFETKPAVAGVTTLPATAVSQESVTLNGEFTGNGEETTYWFEYGPSEEYGSKTEVTEAGSPTGTVPISVVLTSYEGFKTYHFRLVAKNPIGETKGVDMTFPPQDAELPEVLGGEASDLGPTSATLSAQVDPNRWDTVYAFDYGPTQGYGSSTVLKDVIDGNGTDPVPVSATLTELAPGTIYHFRVVAINLVGTTHGPDMTFTTPDLPVVESIATGGVTTSSARLAASIRPNASPTTVHFEYGPTSGLGQSTSETGSIGDDLTSHEIGTEVTGLTAGTTYHYRVVATNAVGSTSSAEGTFTTGALPQKGPEQAPPVICKRGFVKRHGRCVKRHHRRKHHRRNHRSGRNG